MIKTFIAGLVIFINLLGFSESAMGNNDLDYISMLKTVNYKMAINVDYENGIIIGSCKITVRNDGSKKIKKMPVILYRLFEVQSVTGKKDKELKFIQNVRLFEDWKKIQVNFIQVELEKALKPGKSVEITINYTGHLLGYVETGMRYVRDSVNPEFTIIRMDAYAYPIVGYPSIEIIRKMMQQEYNYEVRVTVPDTLFVANGGRLVNTEYKNGKASYTYRNIKLAWRMDFAIAKYNVINSGIHNIYHFPEDSVGAAAISTSMKKVMTLYSDWFGPLDDATPLSIIEIPDKWGSQTDVSSIIQSAAAFKKREQMYELYHELAHMWQPVSLDFSASRLESEGLSSFLQYLTAEKLEGRANEIEKESERILLNLNKSFTNNPSHAQVAMADYGVKGMTGYSYRKGMLYYTLLYMLLGEKEFLTIHGGFYQKYKKDGATQSQYIQFLKTSTSLDLDKFIEDWVYGIESNKIIMSKRTIEEILNIYK